MFTQTQLSLSRAAWVAGTAQYVVEAVWRGGVRATCMVRQLQFTNFLWPLLYRLLLASIHYVVVSSGKLEGDLI